MTIPLTSSERRARIQEIKDRMENYRAIRLVTQIKQQREFERHMATIDSASLIETLGVQ